MKFLFFCIWCVIGFFIGGLFGAFIAAILYGVGWLVVAALYILLVKSGGSL